MKKSALTVIVSGLLFAAACDNSDSAYLVVYNATANDVVSLALSGPEKTGNLLDTPVIEPGETPEDYVVLSTEVEPGTYTWRIEYGGGAGLATFYDSAEWDIEIELFPGRNTLRLEESAGGL